MKNLVIGCGFSGATIANLIADKHNEKVIIIDKKNHIGGNCYDYLDSNGIMIHKYGSHIFHTQSETVWNFIKQFADFNQYMHKVYAVIDGIFTTIPFNLSSLYDIFPMSIANKLESKLLEKFEYNSKIPILKFKEQEDKDLQFLADYVYEKVFLQYTAKQWNILPTQVDSAVTARVPILISKDTRYFQDKYQGIPLNGYTALIKKMITHPNIEIRLGQDYKNVNEQFDRIFYWGSIDEYFDYEYGALPYRSVKFKFEEFAQEFYQKNSVINYPCNYDFTRIHEYKYYLNNQSGQTVIAKEYSENFEIGKNERYYPIPTEENIALYNKYLKKAKGLKNTYFLGRLGDYKYYDMDKAIKRAIELYEEVYDGKSIDTCTCV